MSRRNRPLQVEPVSSHYLLLAFQSFLSSIRGGVPSLDAFSDHASTTSGHRRHMRAAAAAVVLGMIRLGDSVARSRYWRKRIGQCAMTQPLSAWPRYELDAATVDGFKRGVVGHVLALCAEPNDPLTRLKPSLDRVFTLCEFTPEQHKASVAAALGEGFTDLEHVIANWHVATCICEALDRPDDDSDRKVRYDTDPNAAASIDANVVQTGTLLSCYVAYLLVYRTEMLPCHPDIGKRTAADTGSALRRVGPWDRAHVSRLLLQRPPDDDENSDDDPTRTWSSDPNLRQGVDAARGLRGVASVGERWALIARVWVEILLWIAAANKAPEHLRQLTLGAEFLTDLWLLLGHIGACEQ
jgi:hypothetical protein